MASEPSTSEGFAASAAIVADVARERQLQQMREIDGLDLKAATLLGFSAVLLGLLFQSDLATANWNWVLTIGSISIGLATLPLGYALLPRSYSFNPSISALSKFLPLETAATHETIAVSIGRAIRSNQPILRRKTTAVRAGVVFLVVAVSVVGGRLIYVAGSADPATNEGEGNGTAQSSTQV